MTWDLLDENCSDISDWADEDVRAAVSEVDPAGQFRFDTNTSSVTNDYCQRSRNIGSYPDIFTLEIKLYHDALGAIGDIDYFGINLRQADKCLFINFNSDGLRIHDTNSGYTNVGADLVKEGVSAEWQIWRFLVDYTGVASEGTVDVYLKDSTHDWEKVGTAIPCSTEGSFDDGYTHLQQNGRTHDDRITHIDYMKIATGLNIPGLYDINNDFRSVDYELKDINNDFRTKIEELYDINNDFRMANALIYDINNKFNTKYRILPEHFLDDNLLRVYDVHDTMEDNVPIDEWHVIQYSNLGSTIVKGYDTKIVKKQEPGSSEYEIFYQFMNSDNLIRVKEFWHENDGDGYLLVKESDCAEDYPIFVNQGDVDRHFGHGVYEIWESGIYIEDVTIDNYVTYLDTEQINTDAGTFDCIKVKIYQTLTNESWWEHYTYTIWFEPTIGIIKREMIEIDWEEGGEESEQRTVYTLKEYCKLYDINNDIRTITEVIGDFNNKIHTVIRPEININNKFNLALEAEVIDVNNDIRTHRLQISDIKNDFRLLASYQVPGDAGILPLGKSKFTVKINDEDKTSILDLDSLSWTETLNSSFEASFILAVPYDSPLCPSENQSVEILFNNHRKFYGYITNINKISNPEGIRILAENEYWNLNKTEVNFNVGRNQERESGTYYSTIKSALCSLGFNHDIGNFIPTKMSLVGAKADIISQLVKESGNFGWFITPDGTYKLQTSGSGDCITLEEQQLGENLGLYQMIEHNIVEDSSGVVNKLKVIMGEDIIPGYNNEFKFSYVNAKTIEYDQNAMEHLRGLSIGFPYWGTKYIPGYEPFPCSKYVQSIEWLDPLKNYYCTLRRTSSWGDYKITYLCGTIPGSGRPFLYKYVRGVRIKYGWLCDNAKVVYSTPHWLIWGGIYAEARKDRNFYVTMGDYPKQIQKDLVLSNLNVQQEVNYRTWSGEQKYRIKTYCDWEWIPYPEGEETKREYCRTEKEWWGEVNVEKYIKIWGHNDEAYARNYANWQLSKTCDVKKRGTVTITMDCADFYGIDLSKRIKIGNDYLNIVSINYNVGSYLVVLTLESQRAYKRTVSIPVH